MFNVRFDDIIPCKTPDPLKHDFSFRNHFSPLYFPEPSGSLLSSEKMGVIDSYSPVFCKKFLTAIIILKGKIEKLEHL